MPRSVCCSLGCAALRLSQACDHCIGDTPSRHLAGATLRTERGVSQDDGGDGGHLQGRRCCCTNGCCVSPPGLHSILFASSSVQVLPTHAVEHRNRMTLQAELKKEGGYALGSQIEGGPQTPAGMRLSQAMAKEALMIRHAPDQLCLAPCADGDIPWYVKLLECSNNWVTQMSLACPALLMAFDCLLDPWHVQSFRYGAVKLLLYSLRLPVALFVGGNPATCRRWSSATAGRRSFSRSASRRT